VGLAPAANCLHAFAEDGLGQNGGGGGAVTRDVAGLAGDFANHLRAHVLEGSRSSISLATVTPSLVMMGAPNFFSITALRPLGPRVIFTASARAFTPRRIACGNSLR